MVSIYLVLSKTTIHEALSAVTVVDKGIMSLEQRSVGLRFFVDVESDHRVGTCRIHSWPKMCCIENTPYKDCCTDTIYGDNTESLMPKRRETLVFVHPTLYPHDLIGSCIFIVEYKCKRQKRATHFDVNIPFNTNTKTKTKSEYLKDYYHEKPSSCNSLDEDALHDCIPVNCDLKYSGRRPFFDPIRRKCASAPNCKTNFKRSLPDIAYVPKSNICRDLDQFITVGDIYGISTGLGVVSEPAKTTINQMTVRVKSNCSTISQNLALLRDLMTGKLCPLYTGDTSEYKECCLRALLSICVCVIVVSALLLSMVCCIHTTFYCYKKWTTGELTFAFQNLMRKMRNNKKNVHRKPSMLSRDLTNNLLKEVLTRDLPLELRDSIVEICERIGREVKRKKRYRMVDLGSQINLLEDESRASTASSSMHGDEE